MQGVSGITVVTLASAMFCVATSAFAQTDIFLPPVSYPSHEPGTVVIANLNDDNYKDLVVTDRNGNKFSIFYNDGAGGFGSAVIYESHGNVTSLPAVGDFNGDGRMDVAVPHARSSTLEVFLQDGSGGFVHQESWTQSFGTYHVEAFAADFDKDGVSDIVLLAELSHDLAVFAGSPDGLERKATFSLGDACYGLTVGDLDGNGFTDIAVPQHYHQRTVVLFNQGNFIFDKLVDINDLGSRPVGIVAADFDGDFVDELAVASRDSHFVSFLDFDPNQGHFYLQDSISPGTGPLFLASGDFDFDGDIDVVSANIYNSTASILFNDNGIFTLGDSFSTGSMSRITSGDLNNDQVPDLVIPFGPQHKFHVYHAITPVCFTVEAFFSNPESGYFVSQNPIEGLCEGDTALFSYQLNPGWLVLSVETTTGAPINEVGEAGASGIEGDGSVTINVSQIDYTVAAAFTDPAAGAFTSPNPLTAVHYGEDARFSYTLNPGWRIDLVTTTTGSPINEVGQAGAAGITGGGSVTINVSLINYTVGAEFSDPAGGAFTSANPLTGLHYGENASFSYTLAPGWRVLSVETTTGTPVNEVSEAGAAGIAGDGVVTISVGLFGPPLSFSRSRGKPVIETAA